MERRYRIRLDPPGTPVIESVDAGDVYAMDTDDMSAFLKDALREVSWLQTLASELSSLAEQRSFDGGKDGHTVYDVNGNPFLRTPHSDSTVAEFLTYLTPNRVGSLALIVLAGFVYGEALNAELAAKAAGDKDLRRERKVRRLQAEDAFRNAMVEYAAEATHRREARDRDMIAAAAPPDFRGWKAVGDAIHWFPRHPHELSIPIDPAHMTDGGLLRFNARNALQALAQTLNDHGITPDRLANQYAVKHTFEYACDHSPGLTLMPKDFFVNLLKGEGRE